MAGGIPVSWADFRRSIPRNRNHEGILIFLCHFGRRAACGVGWSRVANETQVESLGLFSISPVPGYLVGTGVISNMEYGV